MADSASRKTAYSFIISCLLLLAAMLLRVPAAKVSAISNTIVINEVMYDPEGTDLGHEWIELKNVSSSPINLEGWKIQAAGTQFVDITIIQNLTIDPGEIIVIGESETVSDYIVPKLGLQNGGTETDGVKLVDNVGNSVDTVLYDSPNSNDLTDDLGNIAIYFAPDPPSGQSICRTSQNDTDNCESDFTICTTPTKGAENKFPPTAIFEYEEPVYTNTQTIFDGSSSTDTEGDISKFIWKINGVKQQEISSKFTYTFKQEDNYTVELTVIDSSNLSSTFSSEIEVLENPDNPTVISIADFKKAEEGSTASIKGTVTAAPGQLYENEGYIQDSSGGIRFKIDSTKKIENKKTFIFTGTMGTSYGEPRMIIEKIIPVKETLKVKPILIEDFNEMTNSIGLLVTTAGIVEKKVGSYIYIIRDGKTAKVNIHKYLNIELPPDIKEKELTVTGIVSQYGTDESGNPKIRVMPVSTEDIKFNGEVLATTGAPIHNMLFLLPIAFFYILSNLKLCIF